MVIPSSGTISLAGIKNEVDEDDYTAGESYTNISLTGIVDETDLNANSASAPNQSTPHAMSEWYGYDHDAAPSFVNAKAVSKALQTGVNREISSSISDFFSFSNKSIKYAIYNVMDLIERVIDLIFKSVVLTSGKLAISVPN